MAPWHFRAERLELRVQGAAGPSLLMQRPLPQRVSFAHVLKHLASWAFRGFEAWWPQL